MVFLTRLEESIKAIPWFTFEEHLQYLQPLNFFEHLFLLPLPKAFKSFLVSKPWKQKCAISFHSLLPLPKRIRQGLTAWILFVSLFSLFPKEQKTNRLNSFVSPFYLVKDSKRNSLRILLILPFPLYKRFQRTNRLRYHLYPLHKVSKD